MDQIKLNNANFHNICRTCLKECSKMQHIFDCSVAEMLMACVSLQVNQDDGLPSRICVQCLRQVNRSFSFKQLCERSNAVLITYVKDHGIPRKIPIESNLSTSNNDNLQVQQIANEPQVSDKADLLHWNISSSNSSDQVDRNESSRILPFHSVDNVNQGLHTASNTEKQIKIKEKRHKCHICQKAFLKPCQLAEHIVRHSGGPTPEVCDCCGNKYMSLYALKRHKRLEHLGDRPYICQVCQKGFLFPGGLRTHLRLHRNERSFVCPINSCGKAFILQQVLKVHMRSHTGEKNFACGFCPRAFAQSTSLRVHERTHTGDRPHLCPYCAQRFVQSSQLITHVRRHHSDEQPKMRERCSLCAKEFTGSYELKVHMRKHTGDRPFVCEICQQRFMSKKGLQRHMSVHNDIRNHICHICNKAFKASKTLVIHMRTHTGERPYMCEVCGQRFTQSTTRNAHTKTRHRHVSIESETVVLAETM